MDTNVPSDTVASVQARALKAEKEVCAVHSSVCVPACHLLIASCPHSFDVFVTLPLPAIFLISLYTSILPTTIFASRFCGCVRRCRRRSTTQPCGATAPHRWGLAF